MGAIVLFEQGPPIAVPFRFLLTAPLFGIAAGVLLAWLGPDALASRWSPGAVAITHLLTAGYMLQAMFGALLQFLPVAAGGNVWQPRLLAALVHPAVTAGAALFCASFLEWNPAARRLAEVLLSSGAAGYGCAVGIALLRTTASNATAHVLRGSVLSLLATVVLGVLLVEALNSSFTLALVKTANLHAAWGLGGWGLLLLAGVSMYVVPMFQLTPSYPRWLGRLLAPGLLGALLVLSILSASTDGSAWRAGAVDTAALLAILFAATTLWLQQHRRRPRIDATFVFFRSAMVCLLAAGFLLALLWTRRDPDPASQTLLGMLTLVGVFVSAVNGMLYKIVPFLCSLDLQRQSRPGKRGPSMMQLIPQRAMSGQLWLHLTALGLLLGAAWLPRLTGAAGIAFAASCAWLQWNLARAVRRYLKLKDQIRADGPTGGS